MKIHHIFTIKIVLYSSIEVEQLQQCDLAAKINVPETLTDVEGRR